MARIFKNTLLYTVGNILPKAANFILLPIYTYYLSSSDFGIIESVMAISPILIILFSFSFGASIFRLYYDYESEESKKTFFSTLTISTVVISTVFLILLWFFRSFIENIYSDIPFQPFFWYVIIATYLTNLFDLPQKYLMLKDKALAFITLSLVKFAINASLILWFIIEQNEGASGYLKAGVISALVLLPLYGVISYRIINFKFSFVVLKNVLSYCLPIIPTLLSAWVLDLSDRIFIERFFSLEEVGVYSLAYKIAGIVLIVVTSFGMAYRPIFFKFANMEDLEHGKQEIYKYNYIFLLLFLLLGFAVSLVSKEVIILLFNVEYVDAYLYIPLIVLSYVFSVAGSLVSRYFEQSKLMKVNMYIYFAMAILNLGLNYWLIPRYGAYGAAIATIISLLFGFVYGYFYSRKNGFFVSFNWKKLVPITAVLIILFVLFNYIIVLTNVHYSLIVKCLVALVAGIIFLLKYLREYKLIFIKN